jgi:hypothetical protein
VHAVSAKLDQLATHIPFLYTLKNMFRCNFQMEEAVEASESDVVACNNYGQRDRKVGGFVPGANTDVTVGKREQRWQKMGCSNEWRATTSPLQ